MKTMSWPARHVSVAVTALISSGACQKIPRNIIIIFILDERLADMVEFSDETEL